MHDAAQGLAFFFQRGQKLRQSLLPETLFPERFDMLELVAYRRDVGLQPSEGIIQLSLESFGSGAFPQQRALQFGQQQIKGIGVFFTPDAHIAHERDKLPA